LKIQHHFEDNVHGFVQSTEYFLTEPAAEGLFKAGNFSQQHLISDISSPRFVRFVVQGLPPPPAKGTDQEKKTVKRALDAEIR